MCSDHFDLPSDAHVGDAIFICIACHLCAWGNTKTPYFVSLSSPFSIVAYSLNSACQGFYSSLSDLGKPPAAWIKALKEPLLVKGDYQLTSKLHVLNTRILILHFVLSSIGTAGLTVLIYEYLKGFLSDRVKYHEVTFDLGADGAVDAHAATMSALVKPLQS